VQAGETIVADVPIEAPLAAGEYTLVVAPVRERAPAPPAGATLQIPIRVSAD